MLILAIYYTIADVVLLLQCFYYRGFTWRDEVPRVGDDDEAVVESEGDSGRGRNKGKGRAADGDGVDERTALLGRGQQERGVASSAASATTNATLAPHHNNDHRLAVGDFGPYDGTRERRGSNWSHLSPVVPLIDPADLEAEILHQPRRGNGNRSRPSAASGPTKLQSFLFNSLAILMVCAAGVMGWFLSREYYPPSNQPSSTELPSSGPDSGPHDDNPSTGTGVEFSLWGQIYGYLSALLYLGSRLPQLLLNFRRKSTEGVSMLFFLFACLGNLTYVLSILAYDGSSECAAGPGDCEAGEAGKIYWRYVLVNMSWLAGSAGTLLLDGAIFVQFFLYNKEDDWSEDEEDEWSESGSSAISERSGRVSEDGDQQGQESDGRGWDSDDERSKLDEDEMRNRKRRTERDAKMRGAAGVSGSEGGGI